MRKKPQNPLLLALSFLLISVLPSSVLADAGQFYIAPGIQWMNFDEPSAADDDYGWFFGVGYDITDKWSAEVSAFDLDLKLDSGVTKDIDHWKADLLYNLDFDIGPLDTFLIGGLGSFNYEGDNDTAFDFGAGVSYDVTDSVKWRTAARRFNSFRRDFQDADIGIETSLVFRFGGSARSSAPAPAVAATPRTPPPAAPVVADADGVPDSRDDCASTPRNYAVDDRGCPIPIEEIARVELEVNFEVDLSEVKNTILS